MLSTFSTSANVLFKDKSPRAEGAKTDPPPGHTYEGTQTTAWWMGSWLDVHQLCFQAIILTITTITIISITITITIIIITTTIISITNKPSNWNKDLNFTPLARSS